MAEDHHRHATGSSSSLAAQPPPPPSAPFGGGVMDEFGDSSTGYGYGGYYRGYSSGAASSSSQQGLSASYSGFSSYAGPHRPSHYKFSGSEPPSLVSFPGMSGPAYDSSAKSFYGSSGGSKDSSSKRGSSTRQPKFPVDFGYGPQSYFGPMDTKMYDGSAHGGTGLGRSSAAPAYPGGGSALYGLGSDSTVMMDASRVGASSKRMMDSMFQSMGTGMSIPRGLSDTAGSLRGSGASVPKYGASAFGATGFGSSSQSHADQMQVHHDLDAMVNSALYMPASIPATSSLSGSSSTHFRPSLMRDSVTTETSDLSESRVRSWSSDLKPTGVSRLQLRHEPPVVGCEVKPYIILRCKGGGTMAVDDSSGDSVLYRWSKSKPRVCSVADCRKVAYLQCLSCAKLGATKGHWFCSCACMKAAWPGHQKRHGKLMVEMRKSDKQRRQQHEEGSSPGKGKIKSRFERGLARAEQEFFDTSLWRQDDCEECYDASDEADSDAVGAKRRKKANEKLTVAEERMNLSGKFPSPLKNNWKVVSKNRTYKPTEEDVGCMLRLEVAPVYQEKIQSETKSETRKSKKTGSDSGNAETDEASINVTMEKISEYAMDDGLMDGIMDSLKESLDGIMIGGERYEQVIGEWFVRDTPPVLPRPPQPPKRRWLPLNAASSVYHIRAMRMSESLRKEKKAGGSVSSPTVALPYQSMYCSRTNFKVLSYNCLAPIYCTQQMYPYAPLYVLSWDYRKFNIIREVTRYKPDVIALQEIQDNHFEEFFQPQLNRLGYEGIFRAKTRERRGPVKSVDGCAVYVKMTRFEVCKAQQYHVDFNESAKAYLKKVSKSQQISERSSKFKNTSRRLKRGNIALIVVLKDKHKPSHLSSPDEDRYVVIANTHVYWDPQLTDVKVWQSYMLCKELQKLRNSVLVCKNAPIVLCGDFNSEPRSCVYDLLSQEHIEDDKFDELKRRYSDVILPENHNPIHDLKLSSAYGSEKVGEPRFTNYTATYKGTLDYVLYTRDYLKCVSVLEAIDEPELSRELALPNSVHSSDHIPLVSEFAFMADYERAKKYDSQHRRSAVGSAATVGSSAGPPATAAPSVPTSVPTTAGMNPFAKSFDTSALVSAAKK